MIPPRGGDRRRQTQCRSEGGAGQGGGEACQSERSWSTLSARLSALISKAHAPVNTSSAGFHFIRGSFLEGWVSASTLLFQGPGLFCWCRRGLPPPDSVCGGRLMATPARGQGELDQRARDSPVSPGCPQRCRANWGQRTGWFSSSFFCCPQFPQFQEGIEDREKREEKWLATDALFERRERQANPRALGTLGTCPTGLRNQGSRGARRDPSTGDVPWGQAVVPAHQQLAGLPSRERCDTGPDPPSDTLLVVPRISWRAHLGGTTPTGCF